MSEIIDVTRLKKAELNSSTYRLLIESLFPNGRVDDRLRYARWLFEENPALIKDADLPIYICRVNGDDAGQIAIIPVEIIFTGNLMHGGWCVDFFVKPDFQRRGIGKKLLKAAFKDFPLLMTLGQTNASFDLFFSKLGWHYNDNRLINYKAFLRYSLLLKFFIKKIGLLKKCQSKTIRFEPYKKTKEISITSLDSFKEIADIITGQKIKSGKSTLIPRTIDYLNWRYICHPFIKYNISKIEVFSKYSIYMVWRIYNDGFWQCARIVDILYEENLPVSAMKAALKGLMEFASFCGAEIFECNTNDPIVLNSLPNNYVSSENLGKRFLYGMIEMDKCPLVPNDHWKLYSGDCDVETLSFGD